MLWNVTVLSLPYMPVVMTEEEAKVASWWNAAPEVTASLL
jgi:hypothetical protein